MSSFTTLPIQSNYDKYQASDVFNSSFIPAEVCFDQGQKLYTDLNVLPQSKNEFSYIQHTGTTSSPQSAVTSENISSHWAKQELNECNQDINFLFDYSDLTSVSNNNESTASISTINTGILDNKNSIALGPDSASSPSSSTATDDNLVFYNHQQTNSARCFSFVDSDIEALDQIGINRFPQKHVHPLSPHNEHENTQKTFFIDEQNTCMSDSNSFLAPNTNTSMPTHCTSDYLFAWQHTNQSSQQPSSFNSYNQSVHYNVPFVSTKLPNESALASYAEKSSRKRSVVDEMLQDTICMSSISSSFSEPIPTLTTTQHWMQPQGIQSSLSSPRKRTKSSRNSNSFSCAKSPALATTSNNSYNYTTHSSVHAYTTTSNDNTMCADSLMKSHTKRPNKSVAHRISPTPTPEAENSASSNATPASQYMLPNSHFLSDAMPRRQKLRYEGDYYTPKWVRFTGHLKEGYCDSCHPGKWLQLKNSAYWYHKQFYHGISSVSGKPFMKPVEQRMGKGDMIEGLCHQCHRFVPACNGKKKNNYMLWYRHAHKCHLYDKPKAITSQKTVMDSSSFSQEVISS